MSPTLSRRVAELAPSATLQIAAKARALKRQGLDVADFGAGEPDFPVPAPVQEAAHAAIRDGKSKYTDGAGIPELRAAIAEKLKRDNGLSYAPEEVFVTTGAKQALFALAQALLDPGDEALIPSPYWVSYPAMVQAAGGTPVYLRTTAAEGFRVTPDALRRALTPKTRFLFLNTPSNPTGTTYPAAALAALGEALRDHPCTIITDEIYEKLVYGGATHASLPAVVPALRDRTIVVNGFSKSYAMTGWRMGYGAGPKAVVDGTMRLIAHDTSNPTSVVQWAALAALKLPDSALAPMRDEFDRRRKAMLGLLRATPGVTCVEPTGAFYCFPDVSSCFGRRVGTAAVTDSTTFCAALLETERVAVVPGIAFGDDRHVRLSYATSMATIEAGCARLRTFCERLAEAPRA